MVISSPHVGSGKAILCPLTCSLYVLRVCLLLFVRLNGRGPLEVLLFVMGALVFLTCFLLMIVLFFVELPIRIVGSFKMITTIVHETKPTPAGTNVIKRQLGTFMSKGYTPSMANNQ